MDIKMKYSAVDGFTKSAKYKTLAGAKAFAEKWVGKNAEVIESYGYAVSCDGVGKVSWSGCSASDLFGKSSDGFDGLSEEECNKIMEESYSADEAAEKAYWESFYEKEKADERYCAECGLIETYDRLGGMSCKNACCYG